MTLAAPALALSGTQPNSTTRKQTSSIICFSWAYSKKKLTSPAVAR